MNRKCQYDSICLKTPVTSGNIRHGVLWLRSHLLKPNLSPAPAASPITSLLLKKKVFRGDKELLGPWVSTNFPFFGFSKKDEIEWSAVRTTQLCNRAPSLSLSKHCCKVDVPWLHLKIHSKSWWFRLNAFRYWGQKLKSHQISVWTSEAQKKGSVNLVKTQLSLSFILGVVLSTFKTIDPVPYDLPLETICEYSYATCVNMCACVWVAWGR